MLQSQTIDFEQALWALEDLGYLGSAEQIAQLLPQLPEGHEETRAAQGLVDGLTMTRPTDWMTKMLDQAYAAGFWAGWTRAGDKAFRGWST